ncbi:MAG: PPOX class F420-dependent oxidoreductase [Deltaproteobacteria bacterium]|nr:PPOX class F420-dependent oxidoreductase [Deltaproteobacteria bacterium]MCB9785675.1 PPOX class F420-dependent oxidoreductase [Deltaproteobacteria bacterium]
MSATIPVELLDLLTGPLVVSLATLMPDGQPQVNPVWCSVDGGDILVNSAKGRQKDLNMRERPRVTVLAIDTQSPFRWLEVRGDVVSIDEEGADAHIDDLAEVYLGKRPYPFRKDGEVRLIYRIRPRHVVTLAG